MIRGLFALLIAITIFPVLTLTSSADECRAYSAFSCKEIQSAEYNVHFYYSSDDDPPDKEVLLGRVTGLSQCGELAASFAAEKELDNADWSYICCMIARGSSCYESHR
jgi:hypothetical protein